MTIIYPCNHFKCCLSAVVFIYEWGGYTYSKLDRAGDVQITFHQSDSFSDTITQDGLIMPILPRFSYKLLVKGAGLQIVHVSRKEAQTRLI